jgi:hypothetical protein
MYTVKWRQCNFQSEQGAEYNTTGNWGVCKEALIGRSGDRISDMAEEFSNLKKYLVLLIAPNVKIHKFCITLHLRHKLCLVEKSLQCIIGIRGSRFLDFFGFSISYSLQLMGKTILRLK